MTRGFLCVCALASGWAMAQSPSPAPASGQRIEIERVMTGPAGPDVVFDFMSHEFGFDQKVVKGAPYSADAVSETTQVLADGNRIVRKSTSTLYRDGEGRTRREQALPAVGPFALRGEPGPIILLNDPVAGTHWVLETKTKTARRMPVPRLRVAGPEGSKEPNVMIFHSAAPPPGDAAGMERRVLAFARNAQDGPGKTESLGTSTIEGVQAEGTRTTTTIAAGEIGNERPIEIIAERWYSPELQAVVLSKRTDPRLGETVYRLTNLRRSEPARTLFEVPADFTVKEAPGPQIRQFRVEKHDGAK